MPKDKEKLTKKQEAFCRFYCAERNGTKAAEKAGYGDKNAAAIASRLLKKPHILAAIHDIDAETWSAVGVTPELIGVRAEQAYQRAVKARQLKMEIKALEFMRAGLPKNAGIGDVNVNIRIIGGDTDES